jgi:hypothetical protein
LIKIEFVNFYLGLKSPILITGQEKMKNLMNLSNNIKIAMGIKYSSLLSIINTIIDAKLAASTKYSKFNSISNYKQEINFCKHPILLFLK